MLNTFFNDASAPDSSRRRWLAHIAFALSGVQLLILTQLWWKPGLATTWLGKLFFSVNHLNLQSATPLSIHVEEIKQHSTKTEYWNLTISIQNQTSVWVSYPSLVLSFLDEKKNILLRNVWTPEQYAPKMEFKALAPHTKQTLQLWLKLPANLPSEYNLDYFYPY